MLAMNEMHRYSVVWDSLEVGERRWGQSGVEGDVGGKRHRGRDIRVRVARNRRDGRKCEPMDSVIVFSEIIPHLTDIFPSKPNCAAGHLCAYVNNRILLASRKLIGP
jgi:hypothetical protein